MKANKRLNPLITELLLKGRKLNISLVFISKYYFKVPKTITLTVTSYFIMKLPNKRELQLKASTHSSGIDSRYCMNLSKHYMKELF